MPYSITTKDNVTIDNIPDSIARNDPIIQRNLALARKERNRKIVEQRYPARSGARSDDTGLIGNFTKGIGTGFVGTGEVGLLGLAALQEEENELASRRKIRDVASSLKPEGGDPDSISFGVGQALGSILGFGAAASGAALLAPASAATAVGTGAAGLLGLATMAGEASERARAAGATEEERNRAIRTATPFGLLEALPLGRVFKSVDVPVLGKIMRELGGNKAGEVGDRIQNAFITGGIEGAQEATTEVIQNLTEQQYNDLAETFGGVGEAATYGGIAGGLLDLFLGRRARGVTPEGTDAEEPIGLIGTGPGFIKIIYPDGSEGEVPKDSPEARAYLETLEKIGIDTSDSPLRQREALEDLGFELKTGDLEDKRLQAIRDAADKDVKRADLIKEDAENIIETLEDKERRSEAEEEALLIARLEAEEGVQREIKEGKDVAGLAAIQTEQDAIQEKQDAINIKREAAIQASNLESADARVEGTRLSEREKRRNAILQQAIEDNPTENYNTLRTTFQKLLNKEGIKDTETTEQEEGAIQKAVNFQRAVAEDEKIQQKTDTADLDAADLNALFERASKNRLRLDATETGKVASQKLGDTRVDLTQKKTTLKPVKDIKARTKGKTTGKTKDKRIFYELGTEDAKKALETLTLKQVTNEQTTAKTNTAPEGSGTITYENTIPRGRETTTAQDGEKIQALLGRDLSKPKNETKAQAKERNELKQVQRYFANVDSPQTTIFERPDDAAVSIGFDVQAAEGPEIEAVGSFKLEPEDLTPEQITEQKQKFKGRGGANAVAAQNWAKKNLSNEFNQLVDRTANIEEAVQTRVKEGGLDDATIIYNRKQDEKAKKDAEKAAEEKRLKEAAKEKARLAKADKAAKDKETGKTNAQKRIEKNRANALTQYNKLLKDSKTVFFKIVKGIARPTENVRKIKDLANKTGIPPEELDLQSKLDKKRLDAKKLYEAQEGLTPEKKSTDPTKKQILIDKVLKKFSKRKTLSKADVAGAYESVGSSNAETFFETADVRSIKAEKEKYVEARKQAEFLNPLNLEATTTNALDENLSEPIVSMLKEGNLKGALNELAKTTQSKRVKQIARALAKVVGNTKIVIGKTPEGSLGMFSPRSNTITLNPDTGLTAHVLLHEMTHAATSNILRNKSHPVTKQLTKLYESIKDDLDTAYGASSLDEFVAEAFSNVEFQQMLAGMEVTNDATALQKFYRTITNFIRRLIGMDTKPVTSALDQADAAIMSILSPSPDTRNSTVLYAMSAKSLAKDIGYQFKQIKKGLPSFQNISESSKDYLTSSVPDAAKKLFLGLKNAQSLGETAKDFGYGNLGLQLNDLMLKQRGAMNESDDRVKEVVVKVVGIFKKNPKVEETLNNVIYNEEYGATIHQVDPTLTEKQARDRYGNQNTDDGRNKFEVWKENRNEWRKLGTEGQKAYLAMRDLYRDQYKELEKILTQRIDDAMEDPNSESAKTLKQDVFKMLFDKNALDVYFPLVRKGRYKLTYNVKNARSPREAYVVEMFDSESARDRRRKELQDDDTFGNILSIKDTVTLQDFEKSTTPSFVTSVLKALKENEVDQKVQEDIMNLFIDSLPETSFAKSLKKRTGNPGYLEDSMFALKSKAFDLGRQTARLEYGARLSKVTSDINDKYEALSKKGGQERKPVTAGSLLQQRQYSIEAIKNELVSRANFARSGATAKTLEEAVRRFNQTAFIYTIGFNASSAIVNLSQIPLFVLPYLGGKYGYDNSATAIYKGLKIVRGAGTYKSFNSLLDLFDQNADGTFTKKKDLPKELSSDLDGLAPLIEEANKRGLLRNTYLFDALGLDETGKINNSSIAGKMLDAISSLSAIMFNSAERLNRQVTLIASYEVVLKNKAKNPNKPTQIEMYDAALEAIQLTQKTNGGTVLETGAGLAQQNVGRVALMYKNYGLTMYQTMFDTMYEALDANKGSFRDSKERQAAARQLLGLHGSALFFAGVKGLPIYGAVSIMYNLLHDDEEDDFDTMVRKYLDEGMYKGPLVEATGIDFANRVRLSGLLIQENKFNDDMTPEEFLGFHFGGPAFSTGKRLYRAVQDFNDGELERGIENALPAGLTNAWRNTFGRYAREDEIQNRRGDVIIDDLSFGDLATGFVGFPPAEYMFKQEKNMINVKIDKATNKRRSKLLKKYYIARNSNNFNKAQDALKAMGEFNRRHPRNRILREDINRSMEAHARTTAQTKDGVRISSQNREAIEISNLDYTRGFDKLFSFID